MVDCHFLLLFYDNDTIAEEIAEVIVDISIIEGFLEVPELDHVAQDNLLTLELVDLALERLGLTNFLVLLVGIVLLFHTCTMFIGYVLFLLHTDQSQSLSEK